MDPDRVSVMYDIRRKLRRGHSEDVFHHFIRLGGYSSFAAVFAFILHIAMARLLGPEQFSVYGVIVALLFAALLCLSSVHLVITRFISYHRSRFQYEQINYIVTKALKLVAAVGFIVFLLLIVFAAQVKTFFHLESLIPVVLFGFSLWFVMIVPVFEGAFKGLEDFRSLGIFRVIEQGLRLVIGLILVLLGLQLTGALIGVAIGTLLALLIIYPKIYRLQKRKMAEPDMKKIRKFSVPVFVAMTSIALLAVIDVLLVKHFFSPYDAGIFAAASLIAKVPFFIAVVFVGVMFPKVVVLHADGKNSVPVLKNALHVLAPIIAVFVLLSFFFAGGLLKLLFGPEYVLGPVFGFYVFGIGCLAITLLLTAYMLAVQREKMVYAIPIFLAILIVLLVNWHASLIQIILSMLFVLTGLMAYTLYRARNILEFDFFL